MSRDPPPQTVREAIEFGWTVLAFRCNRCRHEGQIDLAPFDVAGGRGRPLAHVFHLAVCRRCGLRPTFARLGAKAGDYWHFKRVEIDGDTIRRAARE